MDAAERDQAVVGAAWRVLSRDGLAALSVRNVAAEAGLAPSSLRYTFATQAALRERAIQAVNERMSERIDALPADVEPREWAHQALLQLLPLTPEGRTEIEVYLALGSAAMTDPSLQASHLSVHETVRSVCARAARALGQTRQVDVDGLHALVDGLALHLLRRSSDEDTDRALLVLRSRLDATATPSS